MSFSSVMLIAGTACVVNTVAVYVEDRDPFPVALAGGAFVVGLTFVDQASTPLANALSALFALSTFLLRGQWFFDWLTKLVGGNNPPNSSKGNIQT